MKILGMPADSVFSTIFYCYNSLAEGLLCPFSGSLNQSGSIQRDSNHWYQSPA